MADTPVNTHYSSAYKHVSPFQAPQKRRRVISLSEITDLIDPNETGTCALLGEKISDGASTVLKPPAKDELRAVK
jgi:hypothetical protein